MSVDDSRQYLPESLGSEANDAYVNTAQKDKVILLSHIFIQKYSFELSHRHYYGKRGKSSIGCVVEGSNAAPSTAWRLGAMFGSNSV